MTEAWEQLARDAALAVARAAELSRSGMSGDRLPDEATERLEEARLLVRRFRTAPGSSTDEARSAYATVLAVGVTALRTVIEGHEVMRFTGESAGDVHPAGAAVMIASETLAPVTRALQGLRAGRRDAAAEEAVERLSRSELPRAAARVRELYKLSKKGAGVPDEPEEDPA